MPYRLAKGHNPCKRCRISSSRRRASYTPCTALLYASIEPSSQSCEISTCTGSFLISCEYSERQDLNLQPSVYKTAAQPLCFVPQGQSFQRSDRTRLPRFRLPPLLSVTASLALSCELFTGTLYFISSFTPFYSGSGALSPET